MSNYDSSEIKTSLNEWIYGADETESDQQLLKDTVSLIEELEAQLDAVRDCQTYIVELDDCEQEWFKKADVLKAIGGKCEHGRGLTDFCEPCGRVNGGG